MILYGLCLKRISPSRLAQVLVGRDRSGRRGARPAVEGDQALGTPGLDPGAQPGAYLVCSAHPCVLRLVSSVRLMDAACE